MVRYCGVWLSSSSVNKNFLNTMSLSELLSPVQIFMILNYPCSNCFSPLHLPELKQYLTVENNNIELLNRKGHGFNIWCVTSSRGPLLIFFKSFLISKLATSKGSLDFFRLIYSITKRISVHASVRG